jgi:hypothetical protein
MAIADRLRELEKLAKKRQAKKNQLLPVPADWLKRTADGDYAGPSADALPGELASYRTILKMDSTMM